MITLTPQSVVDAEGQIQSVILPKAQYDRLLEYLEDLEDARILELAAANPAEITPAAEFVAELKQNGLL